MPAARSDDLRVGVRVAIASKSGPGDCACVGLAMGLASPLLSSPGDLIASSSVILGLNQGEFADGLNDNERCAVLRSGEGSSSNSATSVQDRDARR